METKKALKTAGKIALTIASPPIGAMTWVNKKSRIKAFFVGMAVSFVGSGLGRAAHQEIYSKEIFDNPSIRVYNDNWNLRSIPESCFTPLALYFDNELVTEIKSPEDNRKYGIGILGSAISYIPYNNVAGRYEVNFQDHIKFVFPDEGRFRMSSLTDARKSVEDSLSQGDFIGAKPLAEAYETKRAQYAEVRKTLDEAVTKMNAELETQRSKLAGDKR